MKQAYMSYEQHTRLI